MKLFNYSNIQGKDEAEVREKLLKTIKEDLELRKLREELKNNRFNRKWRIAVIAIAIASLILSIVAIIID